MDYWDQLDLSRHIALDDFRAARPGRLIAFTTRGARDLWDFRFQVGDTLLFGPESRGLPDPVIDGGSDAAVRIPMVAEVRSLNLATSVAIAVYEALRQISPTTRPGFRESL